MILEIIINFITHKYIVKLSKKNNPTVLIINAELNSIGLVSIGLSFKEGSPVKINLGNQDRSDLRASPPSLIKFITSNFPDTKGRLHILPSLQASCLLLTIIFELV